MNWITLCHNAVLCWETLGPGSHYVGVSLILSIHLKMLQTKLQGSNFPQEDNAPTNSPRLGQRCFSFMRGPRQHESGHCND